MAKMSDEDISNAMRRMEAGESPSELAKEYGVSRNYIYLLHGKYRGTTKKERVRPILGTANRFQVQFSSGVTVKLDVLGDIFTLAESERAFVFGLADMMRAYKEQQERE